MAANCTDREDSVLAIRQTCVAWLRNARDRVGGRTRRRYTCPKMPLVSMTYIKYIYSLFQLEINDENMFGVDHPAERSE